MSAGTIGYFFSAFFAPPTMTLDELSAKWVARLEEWRVLGIRVDGERVASEIVRDLRELVDDDLVTLREASAIGGYSVDHLQRLVSKWKLRQHGRRHAPRIRRLDVPVKPGHRPSPLPPRPSDDNSTRRRIVADAKHTEVQ